jgi:transposase
MRNAERQQLMALRCPRGIVLRIHIVLGAAEGLANRVLARKLSTSVPTVLLWRKRFESNGIAGILEDRPRSGRPKRISAEREAAIGQFGDGAADLEEAQIAIPWRRFIQIQQGSTVCPEGSRYCRAVHEPTGQSDRFERG